MVKITSAFIGAAAVAAVSAQSIPNVSSGCSSAVLQLALGDLGSCLQLTSLLGFIGSSGSIIDPLNSYLGNLCADGAQRCSNSTLDNAQTQLDQNCASDVQNAGASDSVINALLQVFDNYDEVITASCSKNSTTNEYCLTSTLEQVQNSTGTDVTPSFFLNLLTGSGDSISQLSSSFSNGEFCTGCVATIYQQAIMANGSIADTSLASTLEQQCGNETLTATSGVVTGSASASATGGAASSSAASASTSANAAGVAQVLSSGAIYGAVAMIGAVAAGGALIL